MFALRILVLALLFALGACASSAAPAVEATFDDRGLATLRSGQAQFIRRSTMEFGNIGFGNPDGKTETPADRSNPTISFERAAQRVSYAWPWGAVRCKYTVSGSNLNLELTIENDTAGPMTSLEMNLLGLQFPKRPTGPAWAQRYQSVGDNVDDITAFSADFGSGVITFCNDDPASAIRSGFSPGAEPPKESWNILVTSPLPYGELKVFVPPRSHKTFRFSLRFSEPGVPLSTVIKDLNEKFATTYPFRLKWPDRRPIGMLVLASNAHSSRTNPRGWFNEPTLNVFGKGGVEKFRERMMEAADRSIAILKDMGAQGMIFWDIEGEEFANINFVGDPRMTAQLAPEMDAIAPEFFSKFHKAGLRTGVCLRPSRIVPGWDGKSKWQHSHMGFDVVEEMNLKIAYAKKRLGCLLFYVDSNVRYFFTGDGGVDSRLLESAAFRGLAEAHPDVLIIPEIPKPAYWSCTAPYQELRPGMFGNHAATEARVRDIFPKAFSLINPVDGPAQERRAEIVAGQRKGDLLLFRCWFPDGQNTLFKSILNEAKR